MKTSQPKGSEALLLTRTQLASCHSIAAQVMDDFNRSKIVQIYLPACSEEQFKRFMKHIEEDFICLMPLARGTRALVFCEYMDKTGGDAELSEKLGQLQSELDAQTDEWAEASERLEEIEE